MFRFRGGDFERCEDFGAIGSGAIIATTMWAARDKPSSIVFLPETLYRVYECLRMGSIEPSVGVNASLHVLSKEKGRLTMRRLNSDPEFEGLWAEHGFKDYKLSRAESDFRFLTDELVVED